MGLSGVFEEIVNSKSEGTNQHTLKKKTTIDVKAAYTCFFC